MHMTESPRPSGAYTTDQDPTPYPYDTAYSTAYDGAAGGYPPPPPYAPD
ncbi:serine protease, partial [Streptomyces sp. MBT58]|nr:serine protease [Streptomyces sp. MBT58]